MRMTELMRGMMRARLEEDHEDDRAYEGDDEGQARLDGGVTGVVTAVALLPVHTVLLDKNQNLSNSAETGAKCYKKITLIL